MSLSSVTRLCSLAVFIFYVSVSLRQQLQRSDGGSASQSEACRRLRGFQRGLQQQGE